MKSGFRIGIVGATGVVGEDLLVVLERRKFPVTELRLFASERSAGKKLTQGGLVGTCEVLSESRLQGLDYIFFDASDEISREWVEIAAKTGARVIDNSATFRLDPEIPLIVPEVNRDLLKNRMAAANDWKNRVVAGPNCTTVQLVLPLKVLDRLAGLKRVVVSTYQSVSGAGRQAMSELESATLSPKIFPHPIIGNCIPRVGGVQLDGSTSEEKKVVQESRKILGLPQLRVAVTAVRVPVMRAHSEAVWVECQRNVDLAVLRQELSAFPGIVVQDDPRNDKYPTPRLSQNEDAVFVGRIRTDESVDHGIAFWVVSDNLRKGASLNAVQIAEEWAKLE